MIASEIVAREAVQRRPPPAADGDCIDAATVCQVSERRDGGDSQQSRADLGPFQPRELRKQMAARAPGWFEAEKSPNGWTYTLNPTDRQPTPWPAWSRWLLKSFDHGCSVARNKTSRKPLMQKPAAGGSQIHFTPALAFECPITTPSRMPMVTTVAK
jgi:hypothetical protein